MSRAWAPASVGRIALASFLLALGVRLVWVGSGSREPALKADGFIDDQIARSLAAGSRSSTCMQVSRSAV